MDDIVFQAQIDATLAFEGGYSRNPRDPGGETNFGISKASYPHLDIANLTREQAIEIYRRDFWHAPGFAQLPPYIAGKIFDLGVNMGPRAAVKVLQHAINAISGNAPIAVDGDLGPATREAAWNAPQVGLRAAVCAQAADHYAVIVQAKPSSVIFLRGWLRRALA